MKKIYLSFASLVLCGSMIGQNMGTVPTQRVAATMAPNAKTPSAIQNGERAAGPFRTWIDPIGDVMLQLGVNEQGGTTAPSQGIFAYPLYQDSTVTASSGTTTSSIHNILLGSVLDPKSVNLQSSFDPIVTAHDAYNIDSLTIFGSYVKKTSAVDTLYAWLVWGDTANTNVFSKRLASQTWNAPIGTWRHSVIGPKITGASAAAGNMVKAGAPVGNKMLVKYVLQNTDSVAVAGHLKQIAIALPSPAAIPAGNIVSAFYTFVPGGTHNLGDCAFSFPGAPTTQNVNGFAAAIWGQTAPALTQLSDYQNQQVDPSSWCMGATYDYMQRYNAYPSTWSLFMPGDLTTAPLMMYSVYGTSSQGVSELEKNGFALAQNSPNPFTNQTTIRYQLKNTASNVSLEIFDVRGVKVFDKTQKDVAAGKYSVDINRANFTSGIYFYSLTVDGNKSTKKMIITE